MRQQNEAVSKPPWQTPPRTTNQGHAPDTTQDTITGHDTSGLGCYFCPISGQPLKRPQMEADSSSKDKTRMK